MDYFRQTTLFYSSFLSTKIENSDRCFCSHIYPPPKDYNVESAEEEDESEPSEMDENDESIEQEEQNDEQDEQEEEEEEEEAMIPEEEEEEETIGLTEEFLNESADHVHELAVTAAVAEVGKGC